MEVKKIPPSHPDALAERHERIQAALTGEPLPVPEVPKPSRVPILQPKRAGKDTLEIYGHLLDQHVIVSKRLRELVTRPADSRPESLRIIAAKLFQMMEIVKEMQG